MKASEIITLGEQVLQGHQINYEEAAALTDLEREDIPLFAAYAHKIRQKYQGNQVDLCGIINGRSGHCTEDCKFCAQSVYHHTQSPVYSLLSANEVLAAAKQAEADGAKRISLVTSGKGMEDDADFEQILNLLKLIMDQTELKVCANLGTLTFQQAQQLAQIGIKRYAHNIETSAHFYPEICTTHSFAERMATIQHAQAAGLELCTGGIVGMGETWQDRIDMAFILRDLKVQSIPINILNPIPGTSLEKVIPPSPLEIIHTFALFRFILPDRIIRPAGGREMNLRDFQGSLMLSGANGLIVGHYLTFKGRNAKDDLTMVADAGFQSI